MQKQPTVVIAGASGFVGQRLCRELVPTHRVIGLSRSRETLDNGPDEVAWRRCDLLSLEETRRGLVGADLAIYLVHAMMPASSLVHADFEDIDLLAADNFARAASEAGVRQIIYLGGLLPPGGEQGLSSHLASRLEVERTLGAYGAPATTLRAGLVLGPGGSSTAIMLNLVKRLPVMVCPAWTATETQPIDLEDVVSLIVFALGNEETFGETYDIGGPDVLTYRELMETAAEVLHEDRFMLSVPLFTPGLSRLWVSLVTGAPRELVQPLVHSLTCKMVCGDRRLQEMANIEGIGVRQSLTQVLDAEAIGPARSSSPKAFGGHKDPDQDGFVICRLPLPSGWTARELTAELVATSAPGQRSLFPRTEGDGTIHFLTSALSSALLTLRPVPAGDSDQVLFDIVDGVLVADGAVGKGRVEIREMRGHGCVLVTMRTPEPDRLRAPLQIALQELYAFAISRLQQRVRDEALNERRIHGP